MADYDEIKSLTKNAVTATYDYEAEECRYDGYTGGNAVSKYLDDTHDINVMCSDQAGAAFKDALEDMDFSTQWCGNGNQ